MIKAEKKGRSDARLQQWWKPGIRLRASVRGVTLEASPMLLTPRRQRDKRLIPPPQQLQADPRARQQPTGRCTYLIRRPAGTKRATRQRRAQRLQGGLRHGELREGPRTCTAVTSCHLTHSSSRSSCTSSRIQQHSTRERRSKIQMLSFGGQHPYHWSTVRMPVRTFALR